MIYSLPGLKNFSRTIQTMAVCCSGTGANNSHCIAGACADQICTGPTLHVFVVPAAVGLRCYNSGAKRWVVDITDCALPGSVMVDTTWKYHLFLPVNYTKSIQSAHIISFMPSNSFVHLST